MSLQRKNLDFFQLSWLRHMGLWESIDIITTENWVVFDKVIAATKYNDGHVLPRYQVRTIGQILERRNRK